MKKHEEEVLEIIDGFKNLTYKIKKENDKIKESIKNKDETITCCKTEYQKLYGKYQNLQEKYNELETYILQQQQQQQQQLEQQKEKQQQQKEKQQQQKQQQQQQNYKKILYYPTKNKRHYVMSDTDPMKKMMIKMNLQMTKTMTLNTLK